MGVELAVLRCADTNVNPIQERADEVHPSLLGQEVGGEQRWKFVLDAPPDLAKQLQEKHSEQGRLSCLTFTTSHLILCPDLVQGLGLEAQGTRGWLRDGDPGLEEPHGGAGTRGRGAGRARTRTEPVACSEPRWPRKRQ